MQIYVSQQCFMFMYLILNTPHERIYLHANCKGFCVEQAREFGLKFPGLYISISSINDTGMPNASRPTAHSLAYQNICKQLCIFKNKFFRYIYLCCKRALSHARRYFYDLATKFARNLTGESCPKGRYVIFPHKI